MRRLCAYLALNGVSNIVNCVFFFVNKTWSNVLYSFLNTSIIEQKFWSAERILCGISKARNVRRTLQNDALVMYVWNCINIVALALWDTWWPYQSIWIDISVKQKKKEKRKKIDWASKGKGMYVCDSTVMNKTQSTISRHVQISHKNAINRDP